MFCQFTPSCVEIIRMRIEPVQRRFLLMPPQWRKMEMSGASEEHSRPIRRLWGCVMSMPLSVWLRLACAVWVGAMAGFFFAFSFVVMPGLGAMEPLAALASMQAINLAVRNAVFALGFFGALVLCVAVALHALIRRDAPACLLALAGTLIYLVGAFGVTTLFNVPLNGEIAPLDPARPENAQAMVSYIAEWTLWNHVRTLASFTAFVLLVLSLRVGRGEGAGS